MPESATRGDTVKYNEIAGQYIWQSRLQITNDKLRKPSQMPKFAGIIEKECHRLPQIAEIVNLSIHYDMAFLSHPSSRTHNWKCGCQMIYLVGLGWSGDRKDGVAAHKGNEWCACHFPTPILCSVSDDTVGVFATHWTSVLSQYSWGLSLSCR